MPCFLRADTLITEIRLRLQAPGDDFFELADRVVKASTNSFFTQQYDTYQYMTLGIQKWTPKNIEHNTHQI